MKQGDSAWAEHRWEGTAYYASGGKVGGMGKTSMGWEELLPEGTAYMHREDIGEENLCR